MKFFQYRKHNIALRSVAPFLDVGNPEGKHKIDAMIGKLPKPACRLRVTHTAGVFQRRRDEKFPRFFCVAVEGNGYLDFYARQSGCECPVNDARRYQFFIGDKNLAAIRSFDQGVTHIQLTDPSRLAADFDQIADLDRPLHHHGDAAEKIGGQLLQPKPDADAQRAGKDSECRKIDTNCRQGNDGSGDINEILKNLTVK